MPVNAIMSENVETKKKKKTKLEKICELEGSLKLAKEENRRLKKELQSARTGTNLEDASVASEQTDGPSVTGSASGANEEKLKEALRAFKRVTIQQEMSLKTLRTKAQLRRKELEGKNQLIEKLNEEIEALKKAHEKLKCTETGDDATLRAKLADLELKLAKEDSRNEQQTKQLAESKQDISTLRGQLDKMRGRAPGSPSVRSHKSTESGSVSSALDDVARLKKELASKIEKMANLEYELESARDEIHELKQKKNFTHFETSFPTTPAPGMDDFFSDDEEEENEFWGNK